MTGTHPAIRSKKLGALGGAAALLAAYDGAKQLSASATRLYYDRMSYSIRLSNEDVLFDEVLLWVTGEMSDESQRSLRVNTARVFHHPIDDSEAHVKPKMKLLYDGATPRFIKVGGHLVQVRIDRPDPSSTSQRQTVHINFNSWTKKGRDAVIEKLASLHDTRNHREPVLRIVNQWGQWEKRSDLPLRSLESVVLPEGQKANIALDLADFLEQESRYNDLALPWHRGYLLHGKPGTGKSSLVKALANEYKLDLWYISLSDLKEDSSLLSLLGEVGPRSILLIEDVDTLSVTHDRDAEQLTSDNGPKSKISLSSLLNALDGVATPHGLITVMTTNHYGRLDPALTRPGRMDRVEELEYPRYFEVDKMYKRFFGVSLGLPQSLLEAKVGKSPAEVSEVLKRHLNDPAGAKITLLELLEVKPDA